MKYKKYLVKGSIISSVEQTRLDIPLFPFYIVLKYHNVSGYCLLAPHGTVRADFPHTALHQQSLFHLPVPYVCFNGWLMFLYLYVHFPFLTYLQSTKCLHIKKRLSVAFLPSSVITTFLGTMSAPTTYIPLSYLEVQALVYDLLSLENISSPRYPFNIINLHAQLLWTPVELSLYLALTI